MRSIPAPGCCIDRPVDDPASTAGAPARPVSVLLLEDGRTDALLVKRTGGRGVIIVEVEGSGR